jgi:hypothetical protein
MTKKEKQYLENLEECFDKLQYDYECSTEYSQRTRSRDSSSEKLVPGEPH